MTKFLLISEDIEKECILREVFPTDEIIVSSDNTMIFDVLKEINKVELTRPIAMHQIVIENVLNTGVNIVAAKEIK